MFVFEHTKRTEMNYYLLCEFVRRIAPPELLQNYPGNYPAPDVSHSLAFSSVLLSDKDEPGIWKQLTFQPGEADMLRLCPGVTPMSKFM